MGINLSKDSDSLDANIRSRKPIVPRRRSQSTSVAGQPQQRRQGRQQPSSAYGPRSRSKMTNFPKESEGQPKTRKDKSSRVVAPISHQVVVTDNASPVSMLSSAISVPRRKSIHQDTSDANSSLSKTSEEDFYGGSPSSSTNSTPTSPHAWIEKALAYNRSLKAKEGDAAKQEEEEEKENEQATVFDYGDEKEYNRQLRQHYVLKRVFNGNLMITLEKPPTTILDCACGAGFWSLDMAQMYTDSKVIGMDIRRPQWLENDEKKIRDTVSTPSNLSFTFGDLTKLPLPFEDNVFDLVYERDLTTDLPFNNWPDVIKEHYRILRPGGVLQLVEYELFFKNTGPLLSLINDWIVAGCTATGIDPFFTKSFKDLLLDAGFEDIREHIIEIPLGEWPEDEEQRQHGFLQKELTRQAFKSMKKWWTSQFGAENQQYDQLCSAALSEFDEYQSEYTWKVYTARKPLSSLSKNDDSQQQA